MAASKRCFLLFLILALSLSSLDMSLATRRLLDTPAAPPPALIPPSPKFTLPPLPALPTQPALPQPTLPPLPTTQIPSLPSMPTVPKLTLPPLPATTLPTIPSIPNFPKTMPSIPFLSPPPSN